MTKVVYSVTGAEVDLTDAETEHLAGIVDDYNNEISRLKEARQIVMLELARRMEGKRTGSTETFTLSYKPWVNVSRKYD